MNNKNFDFLIQEIEQKDLTALKILSKNNGGNPNMDEQYFEHVYFNTPSNSQSLWKVVVDNEIEGFATTNNFEFVINDKKCLCAMPQNVLTSVKLRGKGLFNKLYNQTENDNLNNKNVNYFLTFTNDLSTPIFLNKFAYKKGKCPHLLVFISNPLNFISKKNYNRIYDFNTVNFNGLFTFANALSKSKEFYLWRYKLYSRDSLHIISITTETIIIGYAVFLVQKKKGIKFLILSDIIFYKQENLFKIIEVCKSYTATNFYPFFIMFEIETSAKKIKSRIKLKDRFNFLVKGKTSEENDMLSKNKFNLFFGDIDIV